MKLLPLILHRIAFVRMEFTSADEWTTDVYIRRRGGVETGDWESAKGCLVATVICGQGVVTKPDDSQIVARIQADTETFLWSSADGQTSFVRRDRLKHAQEELAAHGVVPIRIFCADTTTDFEKTADQFTTQLHAALRWRALLRPTPESSTIAQTLVRRVGLPVLGLFLLLLMLNALFSPQLQARRQSLQTEFTAREQTSSTAATTGVRQRELLAEFAARPSVSRAVLCDRIAGAVPERIVLTRLEVEPLTKRFEAQKPLQRREGVAVVYGTAPAAGDVSAFVQRLSELTCCREVRLANVEKERDGERLLFRIETAL